jgi:hypothetical protein
MACGVCGVDNGDRGVDDEEGDDDNTDVCRSHRCRRYAPLQSQGCAPRPTTRGRPDYCFVAQHASSWWASSNSHRWHKSVIQF